MLILILKLCSYISNKTLLFKEKIFTKHTKEQILFKFLKRTNHYKMKTQIVLLAIALLVNYTQAACFYTVQQNDRLDIL